MASDGSIVISAKMNVGQAEKDLAKLKAKIEKTENDIATITKKRDAANEKGALGAAQLDEEKRILAELKQQLLDLQATAKDKSLIPADRAAASAQIPDLREQINEQQQRVRALQTEWNKADASIQRYNQQIADANEKLEQQKLEAGQLSDNIEANRQNMNAFSTATDLASTFADRLGKRIQRLASRVFVFTMITAALRSLRTWLGNVINTNDQARAAIARLQGALLTLAQPLVQVIIPAFTAFVNLLAAIVSRIAQFVAVITGGSIKANAKAAQSLYKANTGIGSSAGKSSKNLGKEADAMEDAGEAAKEATKSFADFDEINTLATDKPDDIEDMADALDDVGGGGAGGGLGGAAPDFGFLDGVTDRLKKIADYVLLIAAGFALWKLGEAIGGTLGKILQFLGGIAVAIGGVMLFLDGLRDAWENGVDWGNMAEMIGGVAAAALGLYMAFSLISPAVGKMVAGIALVVGGIAMLVTGFHDAMQNGWNLQNTLLSIAGILATGLGFFFITGSVIPLVIAGISALLLAFTVATGHGEELLAGLQEMLQGFKDFFTGIFTGDITLAIAGISEIFSGLGTAFIAVIEGLRDTFNSFLDWLDEKTGGRLTPILEFIKTLFNSVFTAIETIVIDVIESIQQVFTGIVEFISGVFTGDWDKAWQGVKDIFKGIWNGIVGILEGAANLIIDGINWIINKVNSLHVDIPDFLGGGSIGINIPQMGHISIPRLAQGAVIPANREFLAVLGDQKTGTNVEAPLSTIEEALQNVLNRNGNGDINITFTGDLAQLARVLRPVIEREGKRIGGSLIQEAIR